MKKLIILLLSLSACAHQNAVLKDISVSTEITDHGDGSITTNTTSRTITTELKGTAWFTAKQTVEKFKAVQTDKSQSIGGDNLSQQGATNVVKGLEKVLEIIKELKGVQ